MNLLDENIPNDQRELLHGWGIAVRHIGYDFARPGIQDADIIPLLHQISQSTFFSADRDFYKPRLGHPQYCLVYLIIPRAQLAEYIRRVLHHPQLNTAAKRMGLVVRVLPSGVGVRRLHSEQEEMFPWPA